MLAFKIGLSLDMKRLSRMSKFKDRIPCELRSHVVHCMLAKLADTYTRVSRNTWVFHP